MEKKIKSLVKIESIEVIELFKGDSKMNLQIRTKSGLVINNYIDDEVLALKYYDEIKSVIGKNFESHYTKDNENHI